MTDGLDPLAVAVEYWERLRERTDDLAALFLRNPVDDFVPDISDLDLRLVTDGVPTGGWSALAEAVAAVHRDMLSSGREMWRLLEHPPGACVALAEALDPRLFHLEMRQWQPCAGDADVMQAVMDRTAGAPWSARDDRYWRDRLSNLLAPWGPIEERINLPDGQLGRYRLHAVVMLRTLPALQAAYCLLHRRPIQGKVAALHAWMAERPGHALLQELHSLTESGLVDRSGVEGSGVGKLEARCRALVDELTSAAVATPPPQPEPAEDRSLLSLHGSVRFSRLRPAHHRCFLQAPPGFETDFFLVNEIATLRDSILAPARHAASTLWNEVEGSRVDEASALRQFCRGEAEVEALRLAGETETGVWTPDRAAALLRRLLPLYPALHAVLERALELGMAEVRGAAG